MSHTPEPWILFEVGDRFKHQCPASSDRTSILTTAMEDDVQFGAVYNDEDAKRIVACINACAGMKSPADEIDNLKRDIVEYKKESSNKTGEILKMKDALWGVLAMIDESWGASSDAEIALVDDIKALLKGGE